MWNFPDHSSYQRCAAYWAMNLNCSYLMISQAEKRHFFDSEAMQISQTACGFVKWDKIPQISYLWSQKPAYSLN